MMHKIERKISRWILNIKKICKRCDGDGLIQCDCDQDVAMPCNNCNGNGYIENVTTITIEKNIPCNNPHCQLGIVLCDMCLGKGKEDDVLCTSCRGTGILSCPICKGSNQKKEIVEECIIKHEICPICKGTKRRPCTNCGGKKVRICNCCRGSGVVVNKRKILLYSLVIMVTVVFPWWSIISFAIGITAALISVLWTISHNK